MATTTTHTPSLITRLNIEWDRRWAEHLYDFPHGTMTCQQSLQLVSHRAENAGSVMRGLLEAAGAGDDVCARTALQIVLPSVVSVARQCAPRQRAQAGAYEEPLAVTVALAIERIKHAPLQRPGSVLGNLHMDLLKYALRYFKASESELLGMEDDLAGTEEFSSLYGRLAETTSGTEESTRQLLRLAAWMRDHEILTEAETAIFVSYEIGTSEERAALAEKLSTTREGLCVRVHRIRKAVKKAVSQYALQRSDLMDETAA